MPDMPDTEWQNSVEWLKSCTDLQVVYPIIYRASSFFFHPTWVFRILGLTPLVWISWTEMPVKSHLLPFYSFDMVFHIPTEIHDGIG